MKSAESEDCLVHVCVCTNERTDGRTACANFGGKEFFAALKAKVKESRLSATHWVTRTGCLGFCNPVGTTVAIHRKGQPSVWLTEVTEADFANVWAQITSESI